ncbi:MAG: enoyl-CoA hydratase/isomerase family protein [Saprospiraceae bacterium]
MSYTQIILEKHHHTAWIKLNRPDKLNALTPTMLREWKVALKDLEDDPDCRVIVVTGEGRAFSAGVDLDFFKNEKVTPGNPFHALGLEVMHLLESSSKPNIAMVNGFCFTGAMELMMAFDLIVAADEAKIGDTHTKWGIPPKWGMTQRLQNQVGIRKAKELSFTAEAISGKEAARIGLANQSVPLAELKTTVEALAEKIVKNSAQGLALVKHLYQFGNLHSLKEGIQYEMDYEVDISDKREALVDFKKNI